MEPTVFVVDDDEAVRGSLGLLLKSVGLKSSSYATAADFLGVYNSEQPGCLVLDMRMPGMSGLALQERLTELRITLPIIFITGHADIATSVRAMKRQAFDFIEKPFNDQDLLDRIQEAIEHDARSRRKHRDITELTHRVSLLTAREREILEMIVEGNANKVIAIELAISPKTVEFHRKRIMKKMKASSLPALVRMVYQLNQDS
ncbi:MAG: response regulator transcription factor [Gammaproteobacteria bacterium]|nr:response regulator transcription factor [Gammaproteobacteria bacterium]